jgi:outer membrane lipoprotein-sorting protein
MILTGGSMRTSSWRRAVFLSTILLTAPAVQAQTVDEIVTRNIEAKGGFETLKRTTSVRTTGTGSMQGAEVAITSLTKRPYFMRNEMSMSGQKMIMGFDGETAWMSVGGMPAQAMPPGPQTDLMRQNSQVDSPLFDYKAKGTKITLGEPLTEGGRKLHHLIVAPRVGQPMHYYLDAATGLEAKMVIEVEDSGQKMTMEMRFSDFKTVDGRTVPFTIAQIVNGNPVGEMKFQKVEFNVPLDDALFRMPK